MTGKHACNTAGIDGEAAEQVLNGWGRVGSFNAASLQLFQEM